MYNHWSQLLDWITGLTQTAIKCLIQSSIEAKHIYSLSYFAKIDRSLVPVSRGKRSCAYSTLVAMDTMDEYR